jgi:excisionase family DNA binding protein
MSATPSSTPAPGPRTPGSQFSTRRLISLAEAALVLGVSVASVRRLVWQGRLPVVRLTRRIQVDLRDVERLIEQAKLKAE